MVTGNYYQQNNTLLAHKAFPWYIILSNLLLVSSFSSVFTNFSLHDEVHMPLEKEINISTTRDIDYK